MGQMTPVAQVQHLKLVLYLFNIAQIYLKTSFFNTTVLEL